MTLYPNVTIARNFKVKENLVVGVVQKILSKDFRMFFASFDKQIQGGQSRRRPDIYIDALTHCVIVEVDEFCHRAFTYKGAEQQRLEELIGDVSGRPVIQIRFNPDAYIDEGGNRIASCFQTSKDNGTLVLANEENWRSRIQVLETELRAALSAKVGGSFTRYLFYDCERS